MDESARLPAKPRPRRRSDDLAARPGHVLDRSPHVADLERDVVHAGTSLGEKAPDGRVVRERPAPFDLGAEEPSIRLHGVVEILYGHRDVVQRADVHAADPTGWVGSVPDSDGLR